MTRLRIHCWVRAFTTWNLSKLRCLHTKNILVSDHNYQRSISSAISYRKLQSHELKRLLPPYHICDSDTSSSLSLQPQRTCTRWLRQLSQSLWTSLNCPCAFFNTITDICTQDSQKRSSTNPPMREQKYFQLYGSLDLQTWYI